MTGVWGLGAFRSSRYRRSPSSSPASRGLAACCYIFNVGQTFYDSL